MVGGRGIALAACLTGSVALHASLLLAGTAGTASTPTTSTNPNAIQTRVAGVQVRLETAAPRASLATHNTHDRQLAIATPAAVTAPTRPEHPVAPEASTAPNSDPDPDPDTAYLARSLLTRPPAPQQSIDLLYPELAPSGRFRAVVTLFIDDRGVVQRVRIDEADDSGLPPVLEDATRQTFLRSAFTPGEIDGRPTRSRLRVEVEYATEPLQGSTPPATR
jgi:outer membrane biosynthesis protein TonB